MRRSTGRGGLGDPRGPLDPRRHLRVFALTDRTDQHHAAAVTFLQANDRPLVTTDLIVVETLNLVQARLGPSPAIALGKRLLQPASTSVLKVGVWAVGGSFRVDLTANKYVAGAVRINGTTLTHATYMHGSHTQIGAVVLSAIVLLAGGDYIELVSNSDVAAPYTVEGGETYSPVFWAFKVSD